MSFSRPLHEAADTDTLHVLDVSIFRSFNGSWQVELGSNTVVLSATQVEGPLAATELSHIGPTVEPGDSEDRAALSSPTSSLGRHQLSHHDIEEWIHSGLANVRRRWPTLTIHYLYTTSASPSTRQIIKVLASDYNMTPVEIPTLKALKLYLAPSQPPPPPRQATAPLCIIPDTNLLRYDKDGARTGLVRHIATAAKHSSMTICLLPEVWEEMAGAWKAEQSSQTPAARVAGASATTSATNSFESLVPIHRPHWPSRPLPAAIGLQRSLAPPIIFPDMSKQISAVGLIHCPRQARFAIRDPAILAELVVAGGADMEQLLVLTADHELSVKAASLGCRVILLAPPKSFYGVPLPVNLTEAMDVLGLGCM
ncbi:unnamed protein product [Cutaneotrichosporon oleaginosum]